MSSNHGELLVQGPNAPLELARREEQGGMSMIQALQRAASDPHTDIEKMRGLLAMAQELEKDRREVVYRAALRRVHASAPRIGQNGTISYNANSKIKYSLYEDIDKAIRPLLDEEGMSISFDTVPPVEPGKIRVVGELSHCEGHKEKKHIELPPDTSGGKTAIQAHASSIKYARRHLCKMFFNIIEEGNEPDAEEGKAAMVNEEQGRTINDLIGEVNADKAKFLKHFNVNTIAEIPASKYGAVIQALNAKRRG